MTKEAGTPVTLDEVFRDRKVSLSVESEEHDDERSHRLWKDRWGVIFVVVAGAALFLTALVALIVSVQHPESLDDVRTWSLSALTSIVTGAMGFFSGKRK